MWNAPMSRAAVDRVLRDRVERARDERRDRQRQQQAHAHDRVERRERAAAHVVGDALLQHREAGDVRAAGARAQQRATSTNAGRNDDIEADRDDRDAGRDDRDREHRLARQPALEPQQRDDADRGAHAERGHQQTEGRAAAVQHLRRDRRARAARSRRRRSSPPARPIITPRTSGFDADEAEPVLDVAPRLRGGNRAGACPARSRGGAAARSATPRAGTCRRRPRSRATPVACEPASAGKPPSQCAMHGQRREHHRAERERAERGDQTRASSPTRDARDPSRCWERSRPWPAPTAA